jgi:hypothetical protein
MTTPTIPKAIPQMPLSPVDDPKFAGRDAVEKRAIYPAGKATMKLGGRDTALEVLYFCHSRKGCYYEARLPDGRIAEVPVGHLKFG